MEEGSKIDLNPSEDEDVLNQLWWFKHWFHVR